MYEKVTYNELQRGKNPIPHELPVPPDQQWLFYLLEQQSRTLRSINTAVWIIGIIVILSQVIFH